ncbi:hypothetical protein BKN14_00040 [Candidatus Gracilibacteria bacterium HOT-871]|nr:hypothetical protein BKN14_00040 [Candidatus Gracilibacteria bacterium HOT-871]
MFFSKKFIIGKDKIFKIQKMIDEHKSLSEKFIKKGFWLYIFSLIIGPIGYITKIIISEKITVSELGVLYGIISLVTLISTYNDLGVTESLKHFIPKFVTEKNYDKVKSVLFYALFAQIATSIFIALFFFFGADFIAENYFKTSEAKEILRIFAFFFIGINIFQTINNFFIAVQDSFSYKLTEFFRMIFILFSVLFVFLGDYSSLVNYSYSWLIGLYIGILITLFIFYKKYYKKYFSKSKILVEKSLIKTVGKYSLLVAIGAQVGVLLSQIDMQMIIWLLNTESAGLYTNYLSIINIPFLVLGPIFMILMPIFSELSSKGENKKLKIIKQSFSNIFVIIGIIFNGFMFVFGPQIASVLFGAKYWDSGVILQYSILFLVFNFLLQINFNLMAGIGEVKQRVKILGIAIFFNFVLNLIFIKSLGVYGASLATGFGWILIWFLSEKFLKKEFSTNFDFKIIGKNFTFFVILGAGFWYFFAPFLENLGRIKSFFALAGLGILWGMIFIFINKDMFKNFIFEVKKLRGKR